MTLTVAPDTDALPSTEVLIVRVVLASALAVETLIAPPPPPAALEEMLPSVELVAPAGPPMPLSFWMPEPGLRASTRRCSPLPVAVRLTPSRRKMWLSPPPSVIAIAGPPAVLESWKTPLPALTT